MATADPFSTTPISSSSSTTTTTTTKKNRKTTALPFGEDGYECFVNKGACRKCGTTAFGKRRCERCFRKFCGACAPHSLQRYGAEAWEECCIGCEPYLVLAPSDAEPIFELEPESEEIPVVFHHSNSKEGSNHAMATPPHSSRRPLHVPLSATIAAASTATTTTVDKGLKEVSTSPASSTTTLSTLVMTETADSKSDTSSPVHEEQERNGASSSTNSNNQIKGQPQPGNNPLSSLDRIIYNGTFGNHINNNSTGKGCCASCHQYAVGKCPCSSCGVKYCQQDSCITRLNKDGTCKACSNQNDGDEKQQELLQQQQQQHDESPQTPKRKSNVVEHSPDMFHTPITTKFKTTNNNNDTTSTNKLMDGDGIECPLTPDTGCCTACRQYDIGKTPCPSCSTKFCSQAACQAYLYQDGTCVKCLCRPRHAGVVVSDNLLSTPTIISTANTCSTTSSSISESSNEGIDDDDEDKGC